MLNSKRILVAVWIFLASLFAFCSTSFAADPAPLAMLKSTAAQMTAELDRHLGELKSNEPLVMGIVNRVLVPHFDLVTTAQLVVGRSYWEQATPSTQNEFIKQFTKYAVRTYAAAISSYDGEKIEFFPLRGGITSGRTQVRSQIIHRDGPPISVVYSVLDKGGAWLVYDFSVDGVSMAQNYRAQFAAPLRQGGLQKLVQDLKQRNG